MVGRVDSRERRKNELGGASERRLTRAPNETQQMLLGSGQRSVPVARARPRRNAR